MIAMYYAYVDESAIIVYLFEFHVMIPKPILKYWPDMDFLSSTLLPNLSH